MERENDFKVDTSKDCGMRFYDMIGKPLFVLSLLLSGVVGIGGLISCTMATFRGAWEKLGPTDCLRKILPVLVYLGFFILLIAMSYSHRPFSRTLVRGVKAIACLFVLYALLLPRMPDYLYDGTGLGILVLQGRPLLDGDYLLPALLLFVLSEILRAGYKIQRELDETL